MSDHQVAAPIAGAATLADVEQPDSPAQRWSWCWLRHGWKPPTSTVYGLVGHRRRARARGDRGPLVASQLLSNLASSDAPG